MEEITMGKYANYNAESVLVNVEKLINLGRTYKMRDICNKLSIFDWFCDKLSHNQLLKMRSFLKTAIKLGYTGYVCFKVGRKGSASGMLAYMAESTDGYSPTNCNTLYRSFDGSDAYWEVSDMNGSYSWNYDNDEDRIKHYRDIKTIKQLKEFIETHKNQIYGE